MTLKNMIEAHNKKAFASFLNKEKELPEELEFEIFKSAPPGWVEYYISGRFPQPKNEFFLMLHPKYEKCLRLCGERWGFHEENVLTIFQSASPRICSRVLKYLNGRPNAEIEQAMLVREDPDLLLQWLEQFDDLSNEGEKFLEEQPWLFPLKELYIRQQITKKLPA